MSTPQISRTRQIHRRSAFAMMASVALGAPVAMSGCTALIPGKAEEAENEARLQELMRVPDAPELIRDGTVIQGLRPVQVEGVGAVNGLLSTGGAPDPSPYRDQLIEEMKRHDVPNPNQFLELEETSLVRVLATIPPGAQRGDPIDIHVVAPKESRAKDLHSGWLLDTRLREQRVLQNVVRKSDVMAIGMGAVFTRADYTPTSDVALQLEGRILGGGRVQTSRKLGLVLRPKFQHAKMAKAIADAVNRRFFFFDGTTRRGIATALEDDFIEIEVHPKYRDNVGRLMRVIQAIGVERKSAEKQERLAELATRLGDPKTAADAAVQLEAVGENAVPTLLEGIQSENPELRFYAAEALAYLGRVEAIDPLERAVREVAAFRHPSLIALQGIEQQLAIDALKRLLNEQSMETRYGAFCSIRRRVDGKSVLRGRSMETFRLYEVPSSSSAAVVVSLREQPEIVLMGSLQPLEIPQYLMLPGGIMIKPDTERPDHYRVLRFQPGKDDQKAVVPNTVAAVAAGITAVGGRYGDVIAMLRTAKDKGYLVDQLAIDPVPEPVRMYYRDEDEGTSDDGPTLDLNNLGDESEADTTE